MTARSAEITGDQFGLSDTVTETTVLSLVKSAVEVRGDPARSRHKPVIPRHWRGGNMKGRFTAFSSLSQGCGWASSC